MQETINILIFLKKLSYSNLVKLYQNVNIANVPQICLFTAVFSQKIAEYIIENVSFFVKLTLH